MKPISTSTYAYPIAALHRAEAILRDKPPKGRSPAEIIKDQQRQAMHDLEEKVEYMRDRIGVMYENLDILVRHQLEGQPSNIVDFAIETTRENIRLRRDCLLLATELDIRGSDSHPDAI